MPPRKTNQKLDLDGDTPPSDLDGVRKDVIAAKPRNTRTTRSSTHLATPVPSIDVAKITEGQNATEAKQRKPRRTKEEVEADKIDAAKRREEKAEKKRKREEAAAAAKELTARKRLAADAERKEKLKKVKKLELDSEKKNKEELAILNGVLAKKNAKAKSVSKTDAKDPTKTKVKAPKRKGCESEATCESEEGELLDLGDGDEDLIPSEFIMVSTKRRASIHDPEVITETNSNMSTDEDSIETLVPVASTRTKASSKRTPKAAPTDDVIVPEVESAIIKPASEDDVEYAKAKKRKIILTVSPRNSVDPGDEADSEMLLDDSIEPVTSKRVKGSSKPTPKAAATSKVVPNTHSRPTNKNLAHPTTKTQKIILTMASSDIEMSVEDNVPESLAIDDKGDGGTDESSAVAACGQPSSILETRTFDVAAGFTGLNAQNSKESAEAEKRLFNKRNIPPSSQDHNFLLIPPRPSNWRALAFRGSRPPSRSASPLSGTNRGRSASVSSWSGISESASRAPSAEIETLDTKSAKAQQSSQVSKRVTTSTTVKVKVEDEPTEGLLLKRTRSKKSDETKAKRYTMDDLPVDRRTYREQFIPAVLEFMMTLDNPFDIHNKKVLPGLQKIFNFVFKDDKYQLAGDCAIVFVATQRFIEHRGKIAAFADTLVKEFFEREENSDELYRRDFVVQAVKVKGPGFIWKNFMSESFMKGDKKGIFRHPFITRTFAYHLFEIRDSSVDALPVVEPSHPKGAIATVSCAVERSLKCWSSGVYRAELKKPFSADNYARRVDQLGRMTLSMIDRHWEVLMEDSCEAFREIVREKKSAEVVALETGFFSDEESDALGVDPEDLATLDMASDLEN